MKITTSILLLLFTQSSFAQTESIVFPPTGNIYYPDGSEVKGDTALFRLDGGRSGFFIQSKRLYVVKDAGGHIIEKGTPTKSCVDCFTRSGIWMTYYNNNAVKMKGEYYKGMPVGRWQVFYPNKKLKAEYNYAIISVEHYPFVHKGTWLSGPYKEYYENGQLKISGLYSAIIDTNINDTTEIYNPETDTTRLEIQKSSSFKSIKIGTWVHYNEKGEMVKEENFD